MISKQLLSAGSAFNVFLISDGDRSQVADFISSLSSPDLDQFSHRVDFLNSHGLPCNKDQFRNEGEDIYAIKTKNARFYGFFDGPKTFVLAVAFKKGAGRRVERRHHKRALELRSLLRLS
jgi:hypothetical protein